MKIRGLLVLLVEKELNSLELFYTLKNKHNLISTYFEYDLKVILVKGFLLIDVNFRSY